MSDAPGRRPALPSLRTAQEPAEQELIPRTPDEPAWMRLIGPVRSEHAAFRAVLWAAGAALALAAVVVVVRAVS